MYQFALFMILLKDAETSQHFRSLCLVKSQIIKREIPLFVFIS